MALLKEYFELTQQYQCEYGENTLLLMQVGSFFEVYGTIHKLTKQVYRSLISDFSAACDLRIAEKNSSFEGEQVVMAGFNCGILDKYLKKIQNAGFRVVVYTQSETDKKITRGLFGIFSPGTYFNEESVELTNNFTCIWINFVHNHIFMKGRYVVVGVANVDTYTGKTSIFQFKEMYTRNPTNFDELERFLSIYNPNEVILISNLPSDDLNDVIEYANIKCGSIRKINLNGDDDDNASVETNENKFQLHAKNCEKQTYQFEIINKFYNKTNDELFVQHLYEYDIACSAFCFLLDFVYQHNPNLVNKLNEPVFENCSDRLVLANHTLKQLNIIEDGNSTGKHASVLKMLNNCYTPMGKRKFKYDFLNPVTQQEHLVREYDITEHILLNYSKYNELLPPKLGSIKDIHKWERQILLNKISPSTFYTMYNSINAANDIYNSILNDTVLMKYMSVMEPNILNIGNYCNEITEFINSHLVLDIIVNLEQSKTFDVNFIRPGVDAELDEKTQNLTLCNEKLETIRSFLSKLIENKESKGKSTDYVKIHETEKSNYSLECTSRRCKLLEDILPTVSTVHQLTTASANTFDFKISKTQFNFMKQTSTTNRIEDGQINMICNTITNTKDDMKNLIASVYGKFISQFEQFQTRFERIANFIMLMDVLYNKSTIAKKYNYCKPQIVQSDKSFVNAKQLRHCLIEHIQTSELYVTNDIILGDGSVDGILLYGTNAVGKTSLIRAIGISLIMAQAGLYVPCSEFVYNPYKSIFTRIVGNDNIFKGLSTFAVEMSELRTILRMADQNSLILGDEVCSGTENTSAISIFVAGIQHLHKCNSSFIFATHLHEIVDYEEIVSLESVVLKHMTVVYDKERDILIYDRKLKDGPGDSMYGLEVCKSLSLPPDFLAAAYDIRTKYHPESGSLLSCKQSQYNSKKIVNMCELCKKCPGVDVHHLQHQNKANDEGIIATGDMVFHKNKVANLMVLCESCHNKIHKTDVQYKRVKTTNGYELREVSPSSSPSSS